MSKKKEIVPPVEQQAEPEIASQPVCGIVMPISLIEDCSAEHWVEVLSILKDSISDADFRTDLVSNADHVGIIQKRIVQNIYNSEMVVCDVSCKNPNVMFELGLRLAFDKPTIIIKDDKTDYNFDTAPIEHLGYPRDLHFHKINQFKSELTRKLRGTYQKSKDDPNFSTFLKAFGDFKIAKLETTELSREDFIIEKLNEISGEIISLKRQSYANPLQDSLVSRVSATSIIRLFTEAVASYFMAKGSAVSASDLASNLDVVSAYVNAFLRQQNFNFSINDTRIRLSSLMTDLAWLDSVQIVIEKKTRRPRSSNVDVDALFDDQTLTEPS